MKRLDLPHQTADYLCPINGLCDVYQWKTGARIPDQLAFSARPGFVMAENEGGLPPRLLFFSHGTIGRQQYEFWQPLMGYQIHFSEGEGFEAALTRAKSLVDRGIPVILFGLDMFHLPHQEKFYQRAHIPGHVVLMVGYDEASVLVHDNAREGVQVLPTQDLCAAWAAPYLDISRPNTLFGIDFTNPNPDRRGILAKALSANAALFLDPPAGSLGAKGLRALMGELPTWPTRYTKEQLDAIYRHILLFCASTLPELPPALSGFDSGVPNPRRGGRDKLAHALETHWEEMGSPGWQKAAAAFRQSGRLIEQISEGMLRDVLAGDFSNSAPYVELFGKLLQTEEAACRALTDQG